MLPQSGVWIQWNEAEEEGEGRGEEMRNARQNRNTGISKSISGSSRVRDPAADVVGVG